MVESSPDNPNLLEPSKSHASSIPSRADDKRPVPALGKSGSGHSDAGASSGLSSRLSASAAASHGIPLGSSPDESRSKDADDTKSALPPAAPPPPETVHGKTSPTIESGDVEERPNRAVRCYRVSREIMFSTWLNVLLIFVPVGIAVHFAGVNGNIVFAMNAIAIIPLAGMLAYATECVARDFGDTIGSLMNVTFGNAVELIIFMYVKLTESRRKRARGSLGSTSNSIAFLVICPLLSNETNYSIALTKNEIRIVQASLLGSILANLLLILGMCFLFGGLRFREQVYNSTVTQMSACLLSLSVMSLLLPTAFHASFTNNATADKAVLQVSRGTSIILLLVYVLYLLFQLKSHAYLYQSTPQSVIDEESHPGLLHDVFDSSSSSDTSSPSSDTDSDESSGSVTTAKRIKRVLRGRRRRKSSASSKDTSSFPSTIHTPSVSTFNPASEHHELSVLESRRGRTHLGAIVSGDEADTDGEKDKSYRGTRDTTVNFRDFENEKRETGSKSPEVQRKRKPAKKERKHRRHQEKVANEDIRPQLEVPRKEPSIAPKRHVGFVQDISNTQESSPKRPLTLRGFSVREIVPTMPAVQNMLSNTVFSAANPTGPVGGGVATTGVTPRALHRSNSLPSRLNQAPAARQQSNPPVPPQANAPSADAASIKHKASTEPESYMTRNSAIVLLLVSTGLVALCAEFLVSSIDYLIGNSPVSEAFIGLIIIPIVGNAAEHVTAVTVASKNKMDLAIGVAVGSSIQIALFVTPVIVLLGWALTKDMSLYFSLFETISLFVSAFIVNFLVLDGRSNYLEGALLIAAYIIIAVAAFFYPDSDEQSTIGGGPKMLLTRAVVDALDFATGKLV